MKKGFLLLSFALFIKMAFAQNPSNDTTIHSHNSENAKDTIIPAKGTINKQLKQINKKKEIQHKDTSGVQPRKTPGLDTTNMNKYGDLLNDDPAFNKRYPIWKPALQVIGENVLLNIADRTFLHLQFAKTDFSTWKRTLNAGFPWNSGWEWDQDRFGNNFFSHPMMGSFYYNAARANGYNFWQSAPFVFAGSYMWKIFGENGTPEREDLINTTFDGIFLGEILYRLSSDILDDRAIGRERFFRELFAGLIDPVRGFNRLVQGKTFRRTNKEVYQKDRVNITLFAGLHTINQQDNKFLSGTNSMMLNAQLDYGNPFEVRKRKPFDFFRVRAELNFGVGRKIVDNITGYGVLFGKNLQYGKLSMLVGGLQSYDYFDTKAFELSTIAFGAGLFTNLSITKNTHLYTNFHLQVVPFAGSSVTVVSDTSQFRDYRFAYGWQGKIETTLAFPFASMTLLYYYYFIHSFDNTGKDVPPNGTLGNNYISMLKPKVTFQIYKDLSAGIEHSIYFNEHYQKQYPTLRTTQSEQRIFLMLYLEDPQRKGRYN